MEDNRKKAAEFWIQSAEHDFKSAQNLLISVEFEGAWLFGSFVDGNADTDSNIDVALLIPEIEQKFFREVELMRYRRNIDLRIEPHILNASDLDMPFGREIIAKGRKIAGLTDTPSCRRLNKRKSFFFNTSGISDIITPYFMETTGMAEYRNLTENEIQKLTAQGCQCDDWSKVRVAGGFNTAYVRNTAFSGECLLGRFDKYIEFYGGLKRHSGIYNAAIHNCTIGDNCYISNVLSHIANYKIEDDCVINHVDLLAVEGQSCFGNGVEVKVINEAGGREVPIFDKLTSQIAYVAALYRWRGDVVEKIRGMIKKYADSAKSSLGTIGRGSQLINCGTIKNVKIGSAAVIGNVKRMENGTINSCPDAPTEIGANVIAKDFIVASGAKISDGSIIMHCFVGQAVEMNRQFSAENSLFFANCGCHHGEACSIFAGPYTVSHHKATLLIAGLFSFFNAGSSSNQSNHMYKLGSNQQGIFERGSKTSSSSYVLYPAKIGAFCVVMGKHYSHPDTAELPFSYLFEESGRSFVVPGYNLRTVGALRDMTKWPKRDLRKDPEKLDLINFHTYGPYTIQKMLRMTEHSVSI